MNIIPEGALIDFNPLDYQKVPESLYNLGVGVLKRKSALQKPLAEPHFAEPDSVDKRMLQLYACTEQLLQQCFQAGMLVRTVIQHGDIDVAFLFQRPRTNETTLILHPTDQSKSKGFNKAIEDTTRTALITLPNFDPETTKILLFTLTNDGKVKLAFSRPGRVDLEFAVDREVNGLLEIAEQYVGLTSCPRVNLRLLADTSTIPHSNKTKLKFDLFSIPSRANSPQKSTKSFTPFPEKITTKQSSSGSLVTFFRGVKKSSTPSPTKQQQQLALQHGTSNATI